MSERNPLTEEQLDSIWKEMLKPDAKNPPRIDRLAWEPCELCSRLNETDPCYKDLCFTKNAPQCEYRCDKFLEWKSAQRKLQNANFCPKCGRPLTDDSWDMLEKRLEDEK